MVEQADNHIKMNMIDHTAVDKDMVEITDVVKHKEVGEEDVVVPILPLMLKMKEIIRGPNTKARMAKDKRGISKPRRLSRLKTSFRVRTVRLSTQQLISVISRMQC